MGSISKVRLFDEEDNLEEESDISDTNEKLLLKSVANTLPTETKSNQEVLIPHKVNVKDLIPPAS